MAVYGKEALDSQSKKKQRFDPADGDLYSLLNLRKYYLTLGFTLQEIMEYWLQQCVAPAQIQGRLRIDRADHCPYAYGDMIDFYCGQYGFTKQEVIKYWLGCDPANPAAEEVHDSDSDAPVCLQVRCGGHASQTIEVFKDTPLLILARAFLARAHAPQPAGIVPIFYGDQEVAGEATARAVGLRDDDILTLCSRLVTNPAAPKTRAAAKIAASATRPLAPPPVRRTRLLFPPLAAPPRCASQPAWPGSARVPAMPPAHPGGSGTPAASPATAPRTRSRSRPLILLPRRRAERALEDRRWDRNSPSPRAERS